MRRIMSWPGNAGGATGPVRGMTALRAERKVFDSPSRDFDLTVNYDLLSFGLTIFANCRVVVSRIRDADPTAHATI